MIFAKAANVIFDKAVVIGAGSRSEKDLQSCIIAVIPALYAGIPAVRVATINIPISQYPYEGA
jgi:hypothetical protein